MTRQTGNPDTAPRHSSSTDVFVICSVTLLSLAAGAWLQTQQGLPLLWAMGGALAIYVTLLLLHLIARRAVLGLGRVADERTDLEWADETAPQVRLPDGALPRASAWAEPLAQRNASMELAPDVASDLAADLADMLAASRMDRRPDDPSPSQPPSQWSASDVPEFGRMEMPQSQPQRTAQAAFEFPLQREPLPTMAANLASAFAPQHAQPDPAARPAAQPGLQLPPHFTGTPAAAAPERREAAPSQARAPEGSALDSSSPEMNVEIIQNLIKKLADELNGVLPEKDATPDSVVADTFDAQAVIGQSVAALETTARTMRVPPAPARPAAAPEAGAAGVPAWWPTNGGKEPKPKAAPKSAAPKAPAKGTAARGAAQKPPALNPQLARIAEAVAAERIEVLLEPIHALAEGRTRHFEVSVRLLTADGAALDQCDFARAAQGSGLMPRIDAERMIRAARVARRLGERGRQGSVLSAIAGESLSDPDFVVTAATQRGGRMQLILSFAQSEVRNFTAGHAEALRRLAAAGYGFALEDVVDLDMDFGALKSMGFEFVKLDAAVFLEGLAAADALVPASDICRHLSDFGLTLIVGRIEDDWLLARILGFGVLFGKGTLFGGPKLVRPEVVAAPAAA